MSKAFEISNLTKSYALGDVTQTALFPLNLTINRGDFVAFIGPSGSGKTTLLSLVAGLDEPTSGEVEVLGTRLASLTAKERTQFRKTHIGFIFQSYNLFPELSAVENVELLSLLQGRPASIARKKALDALSAVDLSAYADRLPTRLSGGQQQRVAVARALASEPELLIADEPTANLDSKTAQELIQLFKKLNTNGTTVLFSSHDPAVFAHAKTRIHLKDGRLESID
jgi:putative ABC transport system ATP-binding protein